MSEPTTNEFLNAANWTYTRSSTMPADLKPLEVGGKQLTMQVTSDGFYGAAFVSPSNQVVIAYEGTSPASLIDNTPFGLAQLAADLSIYFGQNIGAYSDADRFAQKVIGAAAKQGIARTNVFVTGHSLGGAETEYVAAQLQLSGETFGAPGISVADVASNPGQLLDYVEFGDPVGNYASAPPVEGRFIWSSGIVHVGTVSYLGSALDAVPLWSAGYLFNTGEAATATALALLAVNAAAFHPTPIYAGSLGVTLTNPGLLGKGAVMARVLSDHGIAATLAGSGGGPTLYLGSTGNDTIATATSGVGVIAPGSGNDVIAANGSDVVVPGTGGSDTVFATGHVMVGIGPGMLTFVNGANPAIVLGGAGSALIFGGVGGGLFAAGAGGGSTVVGGAGAATIIGGASGDALFAGGAAGDEIAAGPGNETLSGLGSTGNDVFFAGATGNTAIFAGSGADLVVLGGGADYVQIGTGSATVFAGAGGDVFGIRNGQAGGHVVIAGFSTGQGDRIALQGYGAGAASTALATAQVSGGSEILRLADGTQVELLGVSHLNAASFV